MTNKFCFMCSFYNGRTEVCMNNGHKLSGVAKVCKDFIQDNSDHCVICGVKVPEGRQVCGHCCRENGVE